MADSGMQLAVEKQPDSKLHLPALSPNQKRGLTLTILSGIWWAADHYGRFLTAIKVVHDVPHLFHQAAPYATPILAVGGIALIAWDIYTRRTAHVQIKHRAPEIVIPEQRLHALPQSSALPELRPHIVAVSYSRLTSLPVSGLKIANDGQSAYEVSIPDVKLGTSLVTFEGNCPRVETGADVEWRLLIKQETGGFSTGNALRDEMLKQGVGEIAVPIRYKDGNNLWYVSRCRIELNVSVRGGLAVHNDGQELLADSSPTVQQANDVPIPVTAPRPYLEVADPIGYDFGKTAFVFTNRGGDVAHNLQVQALSINHFTVVFEPIGILPVGEPKSILPEIPGAVIISSHDVLRLMIGEWDSAFKNTQLGGLEAGEWATKITVLYEDYAQRKYEMTCDLVVFPIQRTLRDKHATEAIQLHHYKTVEVRNIRFRVIP